MSPFQKDTYQHKSRLPGLRLGPQLLLPSTRHRLALGPPACPSHSSKHSPNQLLRTHRTHRLLFPHSSPHTPLVGVRSDHFLPPVPGWPEAGRTLQRLGAVQHDAPESSERHSFPSSPALTRCRNSEAKPANCPVLAGIYTCYPRSFLCSKQSPGLTLHSLTMGKAQLHASLG